MSISLIPFFRSVRHCTYVLVRRSDLLPQYRPGSDIDILCDNQAALSRGILAEGNALLADGYSIEVSTNASATHTKIDFYKNDTLDLRFDIHEGLPLFRRVRVRREYADAILEERVEMTLRDEERDEEAAVFVPSNVDDLILRYIEYHEWFARRPDKLRHAEYVERKLADDTAREAFFDRLHHFIDILENDDIPDQSRAFWGKENRAALSRSNWKRVLKHRAPRLFRVLRAVKRLVS